MHEKFDEELKKGLLLMMAAADICEEPDHTYTFKCPVCGNIAHAGKAGCNGHLHVRCDGCHISIMQ